MLSGFRRGIPENFHGVAVTDMIGKSGMAEPVKINDANNENDISGCPESSCNCTPTACMKHFAYIIL